MQFWKFIYCFWANMTRATQIPRPTGGEAGIIREALRPVREKHVPMRTNCALPWIVEVLQAAHVAGRHTWQSESPTTFSLNRQYAEHQAARDLGASIFVQISTSSGFLHVSQYVVRAIPQ